MTASGAAEAAAAELMDDKVKRLDRGDGGASVAVAAREQRPQ